LSYIAQRSVLALFTRSRRRPLNAVGLGLVISPSPTALSGRRRTCDQHNKREDADRLTRRRACCCTTSCGYAGGFTTYRSNGVWANHCDSSDKTCNISLC